MNNFGFSKDNLVSSSLTIKASGSISEDIINDLRLPDGDNIDILLANEKNKKNNTEEQSF